MKAMKMNCQKKSSLSVAIFAEIKKYRKCRNVTGFSSYQLAPLEICDMPELFIVDFGLTFVYIQEAKRKSKVQSE